MRDWKEEIAEGEAAELEGLAARLRAMRIGCCSRAAAEGQR